MAPRWLQDVSAAGWIAEHLHPFGQDTGSVVPEGFQRYVRVFHPVTTGGERRERWSDIAARNGRIVHPEMQLHAIAGDDDVPYRPGSLPADERTALVEHLHDATTTPDDCWFCVWEGWGGLDHQGVEERVELPGRSYLLARGPIEDAVASVLDPPSDQSPSLWWPDDRAWVVATEIDYMWTYVGGWAVLIEALLAEPRLEALPASLHHKPFHDSDALNA